LVAFGYHLPPVKTTKGVLLDKPGKASYYSPSSFPIIDLCKTISTFFKRVMKVKL